MYAICITRLYRLIINLLSLRFISHNGFFTLVAVSIWCFSFVWFHKKNIFYDWLRVTLKKLAAWRTWRRMTKSLWFPITE